ncbi:unnamed protein product [Effrenium voratum]|nr:unnamed protein product [Effrenium voratum]
MDLLSWFGLAGACPAAGEVEEPLAAFLCSVKKEHQDGWCEISAQPIQTTVQVLLQSERLANLDHLQGPDAKPDFELLVEFDIAASDAITTGSCENLGIQSGGRMMRTLDELLEMDQLKVATAVPIILGHGRSVPRRRFNTRTAPRP